MVAVKRLRLVGYGAALSMSLLATSPGMAADLESLIEGGQESNVSRANMFLADSVRSLLSQPGEAQSLLLRMVERSEWSRALTAWEGAFGGTPFASTESGQALHALLQFQSGMTVTGLETLFRVEDPKKVHFQILNTWRELAPGSHPAWSVVNVEWKPVWTEVLGNAIAVKVQAADLSTRHSVDQLVSLSMQAPSDSRERAMLDWQLTLAYALNDQADKAALILSSLFKDKNNPVSPDLMNLTVGRMLYQNGHFEAALRYYDKIPKKSDHYLEAQEERAWTYLRMGQPQNTLAVTQSLVSPAFRRQVTAEAWFLRALSQLKVCEFGGAALTLEAFPQEFKSRAIQMEKLAKGQSSAVENKKLESVFLALQRGPVSHTQLAKLGPDLPVAMIRSERLKFLMATQVVLEKELKAAQAFASIREQVEPRLKAVRDEAKSLVRGFANREVEQIRGVVRKMHIVEAELIQRVDAAQRRPASALVPAAPAQVKVGTTGSLARDTLRFPMEKEFWFDEVANYRVDVKKGCQRNEEMVR